MKKIKVIGGPFHIKQGVLELTPAQADKRGYCLEPVRGRKNQYSVIGEACFKVGEVLGYDGADHKRLISAGLVALEGEPVLKKPIEPEKKRI